MLLISAWRGSKAGTRNPLEPKSALAKRLQNPIAHVEGQTWSGRAGFEIFEANLSPKDRPVEAAKEGLTPILRSSREEQTRHG